MENLTTDLNEINAFRLGAWKNGYFPLPVQGKKPFRPGWQNGFDLNEAYILDWERNWPGNNTGILTRNTPFLDLDIADADAVETAESIVLDGFDGATILTRIGKLPKRGIPFQTQTPFKKILVEFENGARIEFLGDGQQFVAHGIHPDTKAPYAWFRGSPADVPHADLPGIDEAGARRLVGLIAARLVADFGYVVKGGKSDQGGNGYDGAARSGQTWECDFANHDDCVRYTMDLLKAGLNDGAAVNNMRAQIRRYGGDDPDRMMRRLIEVPAMVRSARAKLGEAEKPESPVVWTNPTQWAGVEPPVQQWTVRDLIPAKQTALFTGPGGVGKSTLGLHLAAAHVLGRPWLNYEPTPGPAFFIDAEEDQDTIQRRLRAVVNLYQCSETDLADLHILSLAGKGAALATAARDGIKPTSLYGSILARAEEIRPEQIVIASSANVFYGNEIDRTQVTQFIDLLTRLALASGGSVILIAHPPKYDVTNAGYSGSTAWANAVRAFLYLTAPQGEGDESDIRKLEFKKNQYGPAQATLTLRYRNGLFLPDTTPSAFETAAAEARAETVFRDILARLLRNNRPVSAKRTARNYAPTVFALEPEAAGIGKKDLEAAMTRLFQREEIAVKTYGRPSKGWERVEFV